MFKSEFYEVDAKEIFLKQAIELFMNGQIDTSWIFFEIVEKSKKENIFKILNEVITTSETEIIRTYRDIHYVKWAISSIFSRLTNHRLNSSEDMVSFTFEKEYPELSKEITNILKRDSPYNSDESKKIITQFLSLYEKSPSLYRCISTMLVPLIDFLTPEVFYQNLNTKSFDLFAIPPIKLLASNNEFKNYPLKYLGSYQLLRSHPKFADIVQKSIFDDLTFPNSHSLCNNDHIFTLLNESIINQKSFANILFNYLNQNDNTTKTDILYNTLDYFRGFFFWFKVNFPSRLDSQKIQELYQLMPSNKGFNMIYEMYSRILNDFYVFPIINKTFNINFDPYNHSLPFLLQDNFNEVLKYYPNTRFYAISDSQRNTDCDFIYCYNAIVSVLKSMKTGDFTTFFGSLKNSLSNIINKNTLQSIVLDIFSLIFIKENDNYIFNPKIAQTLIYELNRFVKLPVLTYADFILNTYKPNNLNNLESYFIDENNLFNIALRTKNWEIANELSKNNEKFAYINLLAQCISGVSDNKLPTKDPTDLVNKFNINSTDFQINIKRFVNKFNSEIGLSFAVYLPNMIKNEIDDDFVRTVAFTRHRTNTNIMSCTNQLYWAPPQKFASAFDNKTIKVFDPRITVILKKSKILHSFVNFLNDLSGGKIEYISKNSADKFIIEKINNEDFDAALDLTNLHKTNIFTFIHSFLSKIHLKKNFILKMYEKFPLETIDLCTKTKTYEFIIDKVPPILQKYFTRRIKLQNIEEFLLNENNEIEDDVIYSISPDDFVVKDNYKMQQLAKLVDVLSSVYGKFDKLQVLCKIFKQICSENFTYKEFLEKVFTFDLHNCDFDDLTMLYYHYRELNKESVTEICKIAGNNSAKLSKFLLILPQSFPYIVNYYKPRNRASIDFLYHLVPNEYYVEFDAFLNLPSKVLENAEFGNIEAIEKELFNYDGLDLNNKIIHIISPEFFRQMIVKTLQMKSVENGKIKFHKLSEFSMKYQQKFNQSVEQVKIASFEFISTFVQKINVDSAENERFALKLFISFSNLKGIFLEKHEKSLDLISKLISLSIYEKYNKVYSFTDFPYEKCIERLSKLSFDCDFVKLPIQVVNDYKYDINHLSKSYASLCLKIGKPNNQILSALNLKIDEDFMEKNFCQFLIFDTKLISELESLKNVSCPSMREFIAETINYAKKGGKSNSKILKFDAPAFISRYMSYDFENSIRSLLNLDLVHQSFAILFSKSLSATSLTSFINSMFSWYICHSKIENLLQDFLQFDPELQNSRMLWSLTITYLYTKKLPETLFLVMKLLNQPDNAGNLLLELQSQIYNKDERIKAVKNAIQMFTDALLIRHSVEKQPSILKYVPSKLTENEIIKKLSLANIQLSLLSKSIDIDINSKNVGETAWRAFFEIGDLQGCSNVEVAFDLPDLLTGAIDEIITSGINRIQSYMKKMNYNDHYDIMTKITDRMTLVPDLRVCIPDIIKDWNIEPSLSIALLLRYGFIEESFAYVNDKVSKETIQLIKKYARNNGLNSIIDKCNAIINK